MLYEEALLYALEARGVTPFSGAVYRYAFDGQPPLRPNVRGARWNPPDVAALYSSLEESTARAEIDHLIASQPLPPSSGLVLATIDVALNSLIDLSDAQRLNVDFGVDLATLPDDLSGYPRCQEIGGAAAFLGRSGILVPSMRRPRGTNLVIFPTNVIAGTETIGLTDA